MFLVAFPLLIIPLAIYNMIAFLTPPDNGWDSKVLTVGLVSGENWTITFSDALIILALLLLFFEIVKAVRPGTKSVIDHLLSSLVFIGAVAEFLMVKQAASSTFAILCVICLVDVIGGIVTSVRVSRRIRAVEKLEAPRHIADAPRHIPDLPQPIPEVSHPTPDSSHPTP